MAMDIVVWPKYYEVWRIPGVTESGRHDSFTWKQSSSLPPQWPISAIWIPRPFDELLAPQPLPSPCIAISTKCTSSHRIFTFRLLRSASFQVIAFSGLVSFLSLWFRCRASAYNWLLRRRLGVYGTFCLARGRSWCAVSAGVDLFVIHIAQSFQAISDFVILLERCEFLDPNVFSIASVVCLSGFFRVSLWNVYVFLIWFPACSSEIILYNALYPLLCHFLERCEVCWIFGSECFFNCFCSLPFWFRMGARVESLCVLDLISRVL